MSVIRTLDEDVCILGLSFPRGNAINFSLIEAVNAALDEIDRSDARAIVIASKGKVFCAGLDLVESYEYDREKLTRFVDAFDDLFIRLFALRRPVVAAVNGHALAGGCIVAMTADHRVMATGSTWIGINEVELGIPFPSGALEIARFALRPETWTDAFLVGRRYAPEEALGVGLVQHVTAEGAVLHEAVARARRLASLPAEAVSPIKLALRAPTLERIEATRAASRALFVERWFAPPARERIGALRETLLRKKQKT